MFLQELRSSAGKSDWYYRPMLQGRKLRPREVKGLAQGHTAV